MARGRLRPEEVHPVADLVRPPRAQGGGERDVHDPAVHRHVPGGPDRAAPLRLPNKQTTDNNNDNNVDNDNNDTTTTTTTTTITKHNDNNDNKNDNNIDNH